MQDAQRWDCETLLDLARRLRAPDGCPWDREQTLETLTPYLLEETYEVMEAVDSGDDARLREELADLLFLVLFMVAVAEEEGRFHLAGLVRSADHKLRDRHPHVFRRPERLSAEQARRQWEELKRARRPGTRTRLVAGAASLPALLHAFRIQQKAASYGFDWEGPEPVLHKVEEELGELREAMAARQRSAVGQELGDLLFAVVNLARHLKQDPERSLRAAVSRFCRRFETMERLLQADGGDLETADLETMDGYWERAKDPAPPD
jgi:MazG family protein